MSTEKRKGRNKKRKEKEEERKGERGERLGGRWSGHNICQVEIYNRGVCV